ncbi:MAG: hypothetical protein WDN00_02335 [Limisphaerales bacterium]
MRLTPRHTKSDRTSAAVVQVAWLVLLVVAGHWFATPTMSAPLEELQTAAQVRRLTTQQADLHYPGAAAGSRDFFRR